MRGHKHLTVVIKLGTQGLGHEESTRSRHSFSTGSSSIVDEVTHQPLLSILSVIVETAIKLHNDGHRVIIVSSGAIAVGLRRMDVEKKPKHLPSIQASKNSNLE